jgi:hypothetical protein
MGYANVMTSLDVLGPVLRASSTGTPRSTVLAVLTAARQYDLPPSQVIAWISARNPALRAYCNDPSKMQPLVKHVLTAQTSQHSSSIPARLGTARRLVGHALYLPGRPGMTAASARKASVVAAWVGVRLLRDQRDWTTSLVHGGAMAAALGIGRQQTASSWLAGAHRLSTTTTRQVRVGGGKVIALRPLSRPAGLAVFDLADLVSELADPGGELSALGVLLSSVDHAQIAYNVGFESWLAQCCMLAGVESHPGVTGRGVRAARAAFAGCPDTGPELLAWLDAQAEASGAAEAARQAMQARAAAVDTRRASLAEAREMAARRRPHVAAVMQGCPAPSAPARHRDRWLARARAAARAVPQDDRAAVQRQVAKLMERAGWSASVATKVAAAVFEEQG